ncbi:hypothetical protein EYF80_003568 [Liparis tanakae]|uniref:Uncharacterized protein n=1 Tax=Liparis tanakae TaxID=230148 RepID=A0A4Z2J8B8_9TELE|nr:hypothetical protein EYF80_003568 [Liparis tanakae]
MAVDFERTAGCTFDEDSDPGLPLVALMIQGPDELLHNMPWLMLTSERQPATRSDAGRSTRGYLVVPVLHFSGGWGVVVAFPGRIFALR